MSERAAHSPVERATNQRTTLAHRFGLHGLWLKLTKRNRALVLTIVLVTALISLGIATILLGNPRLSFAQLLDLLSGNSTERIQLVVYQLRVPRFLLAAMAGASLALAGTILQDTMRNPLAGPELLGVSSGAALVMAVLIVLQVPLAFWLYPWLALGGGLLSGACVLAAARNQRDPMRVVVIGAAVTALINASMIAFMALVSELELGLLWMFLLGSLSNRLWQHTVLVIPWFIIGVPLALASARTLNLLQLGEEMAEGLGLRLIRTRTLLLLLGALLTAPVIAVCGQISYVALLAPHLTRGALVSSDARFVLPIAALMGAVLLTLADLGARLMFRPIEIPVGIWTTIAGGLSLIWLLRQQIKLRRQQRARG